MDEYSNKKELEVLFSLYLVCEQDISLKMVKHPEIVKQLKENGQNFENPNAEIWEFNFAASYKSQTEAIYLNGGYPRFFSRLKSAIVSSLEENGIYEARLKGNDTTQESIGLPLMKEFSKDFIDSLMDVIRNRDETEIIAQYLHECLHYYVDESDHDVQYSDFNKKQRQPVTEGFGYFLTAYTDYNDIDFDLIAPKTFEG